jgi:uncharacterized protein YkwD
MIKERFIFFITLFAAVTIVCSRAGANEDGWSSDLVNTARDVPYLTEPEKELVMLLNKARTNPRMFAETYLANRLDDSNPLARECYERLKTANPIPELYVSDQLSQAAKDYVSEAGVRGEIADGQSWSSRLGIYRKYGNVVSESISYGHYEPLDIIAQLLVNSKTSCQEQQKNLLDPQICFVGLSAGTHQTHRYMCLILMSN